MKQFFSFAILLLPALIQAEILLVNPGASAPTPTRLTSVTAADWSNASYTTLQAALVAAQLFDEIWIKAGTYVPTVDPSGGADIRDRTFVIPIGVQVLGGFAGTEVVKTARDVEANPVILSGFLGGSDYAYHVFVVAGGAAAPTLDGLTIRDGKADGSSTCNFGGNLIPRGLGGAGVIQNAPCVLKKCTITANAGIGVGAIYIDGSEVAMENIKFINNIATVSNGGAILSNNLCPSILIDRCTFSGNQASNAGGAILFGSQTNGIIRNTVFVSNSATGGIGGAVYVQGASLTFDLCTFYGNTALAGGGAFGNQSATPTIRNCIMWGNTAPEIHLLDATSPAVSYSIVQGGFSPCTSCPGPSADGNIDPLFVDDSDPDGANDVFATADDGLFPSVCSPAINAGDGTGLPSTDYTGAARVANGQVDMGAYEQTASTTTITAGPLTGASTYCGFAAVNLSLTISGGTSPYELEYTENGGSPLSVSAYTSGSNFSVFPFGTITYEITKVTDAQGCVITPSGVTHTVNEVTGPTFGDMTLSSTQVCSGSQITLNFTVSGGTAPYTATYSDGTNSYNHPMPGASSSVNVTPLPGSEYSLSGVVDANGCFVMGSTPIPVTVIPTRIHVNEYVSGGNGSGANWTDAMTSLGEAFYYAHQCAGTNEIWVAGGIYYPTRDLLLNNIPSDPRDVTFYLKDGLQVYGGFYGDPSETSINDRPAIGPQTVLSGELGVGGPSDNAYHVVVSVNDGNTTLLDRLNIESGFSDGVGSETVEGQGVARDFGGGIFIRTGAPRFVNCTIISNRSASAGGGFSIDDASPDFVQCIFNQNFATLGAGGYIYEDILSTDPTFSRCAFVTNITSTGNGGGLYIGGADPSLKNCVFANNFAGGDGGAVAANPGAGDEGIFTNCTFQNNTASGAGGAFALNNATTQIQNCIIWGNASYDATPTPSIYQVAGAPVVSYSIVEGAPVFAGVGNLNTDPKFVLTTDQDGLDGIWLTADDGLMIASCSPAIDAGNDALAPAADGLGNARVDIAATGTTTADMGAYERQSVNLPTNAVMTGGGTICSGGDAYFSVDITGGISPYNVEYEDGGTPYNIENYVSGTPYKVNPTDTTTYGLLTVTDHEGCVASLPSGNATVTVIASANTRLHVNASVSGGTGTGDSWVNAIASLGAALDLAHTCGSVTEVWVAAGTYVPSTYPQGCIGCDNARDKAFLLKEGVSLYGGFVGGEATVAARPTPLAATILSGDLGMAGNSDNAYHVLIAPGCSPATTLDGFTIQDGNADDPNSSSVDLGGYLYYRAEGGGITLINSSPVIANCHFTNNTATIGGAIAASNASYSLDTCVLDNNVAGLGGAIYHVFGNPTVNDCDFTLNTSSGGGAVRYVSASPAFYRTIFANNTVSSGPGGAADFITVSAFFENCVLTGNAASSQGGAISSQDATGLTLLHCTVYGNTAGAQGGGIDISGTSVAPILTGSIIWGNTSGSGNAGLNLAGTPTVNYSLTQEIWTGTGNLNTDPLFLNAADPDGADNLWRTADDGLSLSGSSPALNASDPTLLSPATDITGVAHAGTFDMGAYEYSVCAALGASTRLYVNGGVASDGTGISWLTAYKSLGNALFKVSECPQITEMWVAQGTYYPNRDTAYLVPADPRLTTFRVPSGLQLYGGFDGSETLLSQKDPVAHPTMLSGDIGTAVNSADNCFHVVSLKATASTTLIDGVTIRDGNANAAPETYGGGIITYNDAAFGINNAIIIANHADDNGGGLHMVGIGNLVATNSVFTQNDADGGYGGGAANFEGGGVAVHTITNCVVADNTAHQWTAGMSFTGSVANLTNCTFHGNITTVNDADHLYMWTSTLNATNLIAYSDLPFAIVNDNSTLNFSHSLLSDGYTGTAVIQTNPLFANAADPDGADDTWFTDDDGLRIVCGSPAENAGTFSGTPTLDILGDAINGNKDMGAYERQPFGISPTVLHVNQSATGAQSGDSWGNAFTELTTALACEALEPSVTEIWVAAGEYKPTTGIDRTATFALKSGLALYGDFAGTEANLGDRAVNAIPSTELSGNIGDVGIHTDDVYHVVTADNVDETAILNGFRMKHGNANGTGTNEGKGGGLLVNNASPLIEECTFDNNLATDGAGVAIINPVITPVLKATELKNCTLTLNTASVSGGGIYAEQMMVRFSGTTVISSNTATGSCE